ncbi:MAG: toxin-antitoxin system YwqK family antitoxin [Aureispira sp.]|nr:toxin-antitoxin system YwqK family antitoxin [Aureispira sp.]
MLYKILCCVLLLGLLSSCKLKTVSLYNDSGKVEEQYQVMRKQKEVKHGVYKFYHPNGQIAIECMYVEGKADGKEKVYYDNGQLESIAVLEKGVYHGSFFYYFEDGTLKQEGTYIKNQYQGKLKTYYANGILKEVVTMLDNLEQGPFVEYYENGNLKAKGAYMSKNEEKAALEMGLLEEYDKYGMLVAKKICRAGHCCEIWNLEEGDVKPNSKLCEAIIND